MTKKRCHSHSYKAGERGFTLLEISIVAIVSGVLLVAGLKAYQLYLKNERIIETRDKLDQISATLSNFKSETSRYPCPADPTLGVNDPNFGLEDCSLMAGPSAFGTCTQGSGQGVCIVEGRNSQPVLIGSLPFKTIRNTFDTASFDIGDPATWSDDKVISYDNADFEAGTDPWNFQMTYAITGTLTDAATFDGKAGAIAVETELGVQLSDPPGSRHYVVVSHGENHRGAYSFEGNIPFPCDLVSVEGENCDGDDTFVSGLRTDQEGANYYDDSILYDLSSATTIWNFSEDQPGDIYNANPGNVGVGTSDPLEKLHVAGTMRVDNLHMEQVCDTGGTNCWTPAKVLRCPDASPGNISVATGFVAGEIVCEEVPAPRVLRNQSCTVPGEFMVGVRTDGTIICEPL